MMLLQKLVKQRELHLESKAELTVEDLNILKAILEVACVRGAFNASEYEVVGNMFRKLTVFLGEYKKK